MLLRRRTRLRLRLQRRLRVWRCADSAIASLAPLSLFFSLSQAAASAAAAAAPLPPAPPAASALACDAGAPLWLYRTKLGVFGPFSLAHLRSKEALFRRVRHFKELRIWRTGASEAADSVLLSAAFGDAADA